MSEWVRGLLSCAVSIPDDSDCEVWWVGDREHARVGESVVPDTNTLPTSSTQLLRSDVATATSLGGTGRRWAHP